MGLTGYLPLYLRGIGWAPAASDGALAVLNGAGLFAALPIAILSGKIKQRKKALSPLLIIAFISVLAIPLFNGPVVWVLVIIFGIVRDGFLAILVTMVLETRGIGARYSGTAIGIVFAFGNFGIFSSSTIGNALASIDPVISFIFRGFMIGIAWLTLCFIKE